MVRYNLNDLTPEQKREHLQKPGPRKKKRKSRPKVTNSEGTVQGWAEDYLESLGASFIRLPDALLRAVFSSEHIGGKDKKFISGYLKGLPDLIIFHPSIMVGKYRLTLPLEIKTEVGAMSAYQLDWQERIGTIEAKGWDQVKQEIDEFLQFKGAVNDEKRCRIIKKSNI